MSLNIMPGPWVAVGEKTSDADGNEFDYWTIKPVVGSWIGNRYMSISGCCDRQTAMAITAVPELVEALKECADMLRHGGMTFEERQAAIAKADAAMAKAAGVAK